MADPKDVGVTRAARKYFTKHHIDITRADLRCMHGVLYLRGVVAAYRGSEFSDLREEVERIARLLRQQPGVRDVSIDVICRN